jgi:glycosyltransferase involved in cell wall biosynthesis
MQTVRLLSLTYLDDGNVNAQQVNAREVFARLDETRFALTALASGPVDIRLASKRGLSVVELRRHLKALQIMAEMLKGYEIVWYPHHGPAEIAYLKLLRPMIPPSRRAVLVLPIEADLKLLDGQPARLRRRVWTVIARADVVVPISKHVARSLLERFGRSGPIIPVGVDTRAFAPSVSASTETPTVVTVGSLIARKRPAQILEAARRFPGHRFIMVGDGPLRAPLEREAPGNVTFSGIVGRSAMPAALRDADILLHPSRLEGMPKAVLEGMACGLAPIVFDDYRPDWIRHGESGMVVTSDEEMFGAVELLLHDEGRRRAMGSAARRAVEPFDWDIVAKRWQDLFLEVAARRRAGAAVDFSS